VSGQLLDLGQGQLYLEAVGSDLARPAVPEPRSRRVAQLVQLERAGLQRDRQPALGVRSQLEAALLQVGDDAPLLAFPSQGEERVEGVRVPGVLGQGASERVEGELGFGERACLEVRQGHQRGSTIRPAQALEYTRVGGRCLAGAVQGHQATGPADLGRVVLGSDLEGALEVADRLARVLGVFGPERTELGVERGTLVRAHGALAFELGDLQRQLPLAACSVQATQLPQGGQELRIELGGLAVAFQCLLGLVAALLEDLTQSEQEAHPFPRGAAQGRRCQTPCVQSRQVLPLPRQEVLLLQGFERKRAVRVGVRPVLVLRHDGSPGESLGSLCGSSSRGHWLLNRSGPGLRAELISDSRRLGAGSAGRFGCVKNHTLA
jgi:hypothetical protein